MNCIYNGKGGYPALCPDGGFRANTGSGALPPAESRVSRLPGDGAADAGAAPGSSDQLYGGAAPALSGSTAAWTEVLGALTPSERATIVATMRAYEAALDGHPSA